MPLRKTSSDNSLRIVHLTDMHFSPGAHKDGRHIYSPKQLIAIESILDKEPYDQVFVTGDISDRGDPDSLLRARDWFTDKFSVAGGEKSGLNLPIERVHFIPGNHDAFNLGEGEAQGLKGYVGRWQKSLSNFYEAFPEFRLNAKDGCKYKWYPIEDSGVFIAFIDTSYLGDPTGLEKESGFSHFITRIPRVARGELHWRQSDRILSWFNQAVKGQLPIESGSDKMISQKQFDSSLKILVAHHYLFEPRGKVKDPLLQMNDRTSFFVNIASANFDVYLCGHKHVSDFWPAFYNTHMDRRAASRHLFNLMRRAVGLDLLPMTLTDSKGKKVKRTLQYLSGIFITLFKIETDRQFTKEVDQSMLDAIVDTFSDAIEDPSALEAKFIRMLQQFDLHSCGLVTKEELRALQLKVEERFNKQQIGELKRVADRLQSIARNLASRPFLQIMSGASGKDHKNGCETRSFNIYEIAREGSGFNFTSNRYEWDQSIGNFLGPQAKHSRFDAQTRQTIRN